MMIKPQSFNLVNGIEQLNNQKPVVVRKLVDLDGIFEKNISLEKQEVVVYEVYQSTPEKNIENLLTGICVLHPGNVGFQYFMTKGHRHVQPRAEIYIGIAGKGVLLMQDEKTGECIYEYINPRKIIYVPSNWAHRHVNIGDEPLITFFAVSADAGHDYHFVKRNPFKFFVIKTDGEPNIKMIPSLVPKKQLREIK